jgi:hypothetical protein
VEAVFVAKGQVVEEVLDGGDAALGEADGYALADALDELDVGGEVHRHGLMVAAKVVRRTGTGRGGNDLADERED